MSCLRLSRHSWWVSAGCYDFAPCWCRVKDAQHRTPQCGRVRQSDVRGALIDQSRIFAGHRVAAQTDDNTADPHRCLRCTWCTHLSPWMGVPGRRHLPGQRACVPPWHDPLWSSTTPSRCSAVRSPRSLHRHHLEKQRKGGERKNLIDGYAERRM